ncbi:hypothetical protein CEP88_10310 [Roseobacter denitrificans]|uniref:Uncharacterized protein n=1 Tax=Roseobacter denitrificans (strain ATCC 33942 / OCh 114) TaxID=375451 RepID=Q160C8_ROSDO|nr:hypothetical protein [Roseobacter denitrificans]ABG33665.1 hypothetical protein RD1_4228 [Roseobacter denitrificans OCh 114]AVL52955.1 hypothetical protein CEP88_10310 [Roseobacter denitrificans]SFG02970.1 hypothetical protein SAMN05443635_10612 [Roseobacter denitrificans OCh 114]
MSPKPPEPLEDFADLRRVAVDYAQEASGKIWTDYNLHDPGVTLLEQTCFALSEIAYQVGLPTRDLLTNQRGNFCFHNLGLFRPRKVLNTTPVTRDDLAAWLCACKEVESVTVAEPDPERPGLFDITLIPTDDVKNKQALAKRFRKAFAAARPLGTDLGRLTIAEPVYVKLSGTIEIKNEMLPETTAAYLYYGIARLLKGIGNPKRPATRKDVWDDPLRLLTPPQSRTEQKLDRKEPEIDLSAYLAKLRELPGVETIEHLTLKLPVGFTPRPGHEIYFHSFLPTMPEEELQTISPDALPAFPEKIGVTLTMDGTPVTLNAKRIEEEVVRIKAVEIAEADHHIDAPDWDVMKPGRNRKFSQSHVDAFLPFVYRARGYRENDASTLIAEYRSSINKLLCDMVDDLNTLPEIFKAKPKVQNDDAEKHRLRIALLDYLIALQGSEMPPTRHSGLHCYHTTRARHRFEISWRLNYLFALPTLHAARATGPDDAEPDDTDKKQGGFLRELALLCDLDVSTDGRLTGLLTDYGLRLTQGPTLASAATAEEIELVSATSPFDMIVPESDRHEVLDKDALAELSPFLSDGMLSTELFAHLTQSDSFAIAPYPGQYQILLDPGAFGPLRRVGLREKKEEAQQTVVNLRATWRHLNRGSERAVLIEHITLRDCGDECDPNVADLILPGWTARCAMPSFRTFVETQVNALAPAHIHVRVRWLGFDACATFEALKQKSKSGATQDLKALKDFLDMPATAQAEGRDS